MAIAIVQNGGGIVGGQTYVAQFYTWNEGQYGIFTIHFYVSTFTMPATMGDFAFMLQTLLDGDIQALTTISTKLLGCKVNTVAVTPAPLPGIATSTSIGSLSDPPMPTNVRGIITWKTALTGRKYRGRIYLPFPATSVQDTDATPAAAYVSNLTVLGNDVLSFVGGPTGGGGSITAEAVIWHRAALAFDPITQFRANKKWANQHRSGDYGRTNPDFIPG